MILAATFVNDTTATSTITKSITTIKSNSLIYAGRDILYRSRPLEVEEIYSAAETNETSQSFQAAQLLDSNLKHKIWNAGISGAAILSQNLIKNSASPPVIRNVENVLPPKGPTKILPFLYVGSYDDTINENLLRELGITYIINISTSCPAPPFFFGDAFQDPQSSEVVVSSERKLQKPVIISIKKEYHFLRIPLDDSYNSDMSSWIDKSYEFIENARLNDKRVLVHCLAGISRSPSFTIAYIMKHLGMTFEQAYKYVKTQRPAVSPNFNFLGQLLEYEKKLERDTESLVSSFSLQHKRLPGDNNKLEYSNSFSPGILQQQGDCLGSREELGNQLLPENSQKVSKRQVSALKRPTSLQIKAKIPYRCTTDKSADKELLCEKGIINGSPNREISREKGGAPKRPLTLNLEPKAVLGVTVSLPLKSSIPANSNKKKFDNEILLPVPLPPFAICSNYKKLCTATNNNNNSQSKNSPVVCMSPSTLLAGLTFSDALQTAFSRKEIQDTRQAFTNQNTTLKLDDTLLAGLTFSDALQTAFSRKENQDTRQAFTNQNTTLKLDDIVDLSVLPISNTEKTRHGCVQNEEAFVERNLDTALANYLPNTPPDLHYYPVNMPTPTTDEAFETFTPQSISQNFQGFNPNGYRLSSPPPLPPCKYMTKVKSAGTIKRNHTKKSPYSSDSVIIKHANTVELPGNLTLDTTIPRVSFLDNNDKYEEIFDDKSLLQVNNASTVGTLIFTPSCHPTFKNFESESEAATNFLSTDSSLLKASSGVNSSLSSDTKNYMKKSKSILSSVSSSNTSSTVYYDGNDEESDALHSPSTFSSHFGGKSCTFAFDRDGNKTDLLSTPSSLQTYMEWHPTHNSSQKHVDNTIQKEDIKRVSLLSRINMNLRSKTSAFFNHHLAPNISDMTSSLSDSLTSTFRTRLRKIKRRKQNYQALETLLKSKNSNLKHGGAVTKNLPKAELSTMISTSSKYDGSALPFDKYVYPDRPSRKLNNEYVRISFISPQRQRNLKSSNTSNF